MALRQIVSFVICEAGIPYTSDSEKEYLHSRINSAAEELYKNNDLPKALREEFVVLEPTESEVFTLPHYVGQLRGIRLPRQNVASGGNITGMAQRYGYYSWGGVATDNFRVSGEVPTLRNITLQQPITVELSKVLTADATIVLIGNTFEEDNVVTTVTIPSGDTQITFSSPYSELTSVAKQTYFSARIAGFEENYPGFPLFEIASSQDYARYLKVQVRDLLVNVSYDREIGFELLYKPRFQPMRTLNHEFAIPGIYDRAIGFYCIAQYSKKTEDFDAYMEKASRELNIINEDEARGRTSKIRILHSKHAEVYDRCI